MKKYFISIVLMCVFGFAFGTGVTVSGNMVDSNGNPVYSTQITLKSKTDESVKFVVTTPLPPNYTPTYKFDNVAAGEYTLFGFGNGYKSNVYNLTIADQNVTQDIVMNNDDNIVSIGVNIYKAEVYEPVENVLIKCYMGDELKAEATAANGNHTFWGMSVGDYKFVATAPGYMRTELVVTVSRYENTYITLRMPEDVGEVVSVAGTIKKNGVGYNGAVVKITNLELNKVFFSNVSQDGTYSVPNVKVGDATFAVDVPNMSVVTPAGVVSITDGGSGSFVQDVVIEQTAVTLKGAAYLDGTTTAVYGTKIEVKKGDNVVGVAEPNYMGLWEINGISESGEYQITATSTGYQTVTKTINVDVANAISTGGNPIVVENLYLVATAIQITLTGTITYYDSSSYNTINVQGANVKLFDHSGENQYGEAVSDENGSFKIEFNGFVNSNYLVKVTCNGYDDYENTKLMYSANENMYIQLSKPAPTLYPVIDFQATQSNGAVAVQMTWKLDPNASTYSVSRFMVSRKSTDDAYFNQIGTVGGNEECKFTDVNVEIGKNYCYVVDVMYSNPSGMAYYSKDNAKCVTIKDPTAVEMYIVTITAPENGSLEVKNGDVVIETGNKVEEGTALTITATPNEGYVLKSIVVNSVELEGNTIVVEGDLTIAATFEKTALKYVVTITTPINGSIEVKNGDKLIESGDEVEEGTILTIKTTPNEKYILDSLTVNGVKITDDFVKVMEDITISAFFRDDVGVDNLYENVSIWCVDGTLKIEGANNANVEIIDIMGKVIKRLDSVDSISVRLNNRGVYIVRIGTMSKKIVVR